MASRKEQVWTPERIKSLRKALKVSQAEFAKGLRVSIHSVRHWEQGKGRPIGPVEVLLDILEAGRKKPLLQLQAV